MHPSSLIETLILLLLVASAVGIAVKRIKLPYSIALVLVGLIIGVFHLLPPIELTPQLILVIFLPALLFEAAWNIDVYHLAKNWLPIVVLATVGVVLSMLITGLIVHQFGGISLGIAFLFGSMIAATDPISVLALFRKLGVDRRLTLILEGESLFNDATAVVLFQLVLSLVLTGGQFTLGKGIVIFCLQLIGGALVGLLIGYLTEKVTKRLDDHLIEITLTTISAYGSFVAAERFEVSPVIAVIASGVLMGNLSRKKGIPPGTALAVDSFWEYAAFVVNSLVFLLIGLQVKLDLLITYSSQICAGVFAILVARAAIIYSLCPILSGKENPLPLAWQNILVWGSLRGALCMAMALSLPLNFPGRQEITILTFGVVLFTLLVQGLTVEPLVKLMGMIKRDEHGLDPQI